MRMIPPQIAESTRSSAERRLFEALKKVDLPDDYCCLHSVNLPEHLYRIAGELDFVIVGPRGLYVIEVKGGGVSCSDGLWAFESRDGRVTRTSRGPFQQAQEGMYSLRERLLRTLSEDELSQLVIGYGVAFPDCPFDPEGIEWPPEVILDGRRLRAYGVRRYLEALERYWHQKMPDAPARTPPALIRRIVQAMRPNFEMVRLLQVQVDEVEGRLVRLTEEQYRQLDLVEELPRLLIQGGAGTGKSFLAVEIARRHGVTGQRVLFVCFSPVLAAFLGKQALHKNVWVRSVHELMLDVVRRYGKLPAGSGTSRSLTDPWYVEQLSPAFEVATRQMPEEERFDVLVVDEAQDIFNLEYLGALGQMLRGGLDGGTWRIFYDPFNQGAIFGVMDPEVVELLLGWATVPGRLKVNCRNTDEIVLQTKLTTGADLGTRSTGPGPRVVFKTFSDLDEAAALLEEQLEELQRREIATSDITILSPRSFEESSASRLSSRRRRKILQLSDARNWQFPSAGLTFATVAEFKGLENRFILLTDIEELDATPAALATVYVGMSRARVALWMAMHERLRERQEALAQQHLARVLEDMQGER